MKKKTLMKIELISIEDLVMNEMASKIYSKPKNYESIRQSIIDVGIIQPLLINSEDNMIISGNLRCSIARELKMGYVPVIQYQLENQNITDLLIESNSQREKSLYDKYRENEYINGLFSFGQGTRVDLKPEKRDEKELKTKLKGILTNAEIDYFGRIKRLAEAKYGKENYLEKIKQGFQKIDEGEITKNGFKLYLEGVKSNQLFLDKHKANEIIRKTLSKVPVHFHEEILLDILNDSYRMAS